MSFERLGETNRPRHVVDQILSSIGDGTLGPGERLPSEAKRTEMTEVGCDSQVLPLKRNLYSYSA